ncbi:MAG TPA: hypothetical protein PKH77_20100 [Anaerolineae bacterium]|nr:hypothetical protein [Anaerolineae bacterium]
MTQREFFNTRQDPYSSEFEEDPTTFRGKTSDIFSFAALITGLITVFLCVTGSIGAFCLPFIPVGLGAAALLMARDAADKDRTQIWAWIGVAAGALVLILTVVCIVGFIVMIALLAAGTSGY